MDEVRILATGLGFPEGPVAMPDGSVILTEIRNRRCARVTADGKVSVFSDNGGGPNGLAVGPDGAREISRGFFEIAKEQEPRLQTVAIVGAEPLSRTEATSRLWTYIKAHDRQNPENRREILADDKLRRVFGKDKVTMFEMNKHLAGHLK